MLHRSTAPLRLTARSLELSVSTATSVDSYMIPLLSHPGRQTSDAPTSCGFALPRGRVLTRALDGGLPYEVLIAVPYIHPQVLPVSVTLHTRMVLHPTYPYGVSSVLIKCSHPGCGGCESRIDPAEPLPLRWLRYSVGG